MGEIILPAGVDPAKAPKGREEALEDAREAPKPKPPRKVSAPKAKTPTKAPAPKAHVILPYRVGTWAGRPNYECRLCQFSTLNRATMNDHLTDHTQGEKSNG